jgi:hypothetical protein
VALRLAVAGDGRGGDAARGPRRRAGTWDRTPDTRWPVCSAERSQRRRRRVARVAARTRHVSPDALEFRRGPLRAPGAVAASRDPTRPRPSPRSSSRPARPRRCCASPRSCELAASLRTRCSRPTSRRPWRSRAPSRSLRSRSFPWTPRRRRGPTERSPLMSRRALVALAVARCAGRSRRARPRPGDDEARGRDSAGASRHGRRRRRRCCGCRSPSPASRASARSRASPYSFLLVTFPKAVCAWESRCPHADGHRHAGAEDRPPAARPSSSTATSARTSTAGWTRPRGRPAPGEPHGRELLATRSPGRRRGADRPRPRASRCSGGSRRRSRRSSGPGRASRPWPRPTRSPARS